MNARNLFRGTSIDITFLILKSIYSTISVCQMDVAEASPIVQISPDWFQVSRLVPASQCLSSC